MTLDIITFFIYLLILFIIGFVIAFPIIAIWYLLKLRKIKQNIPKELKGGLLNNGKRKIEEEIKKRNGYGRRESRGRRGGGGSNLRESDDKTGYPEFESEVRGDEFQPTSSYGATNYSSNKDQRNIKRDKRDTQEDWADFS